MHHEKDALHQLITNITESFSCLVCMDFPKDAVALPCCGQIVCSNCISAWFAEHRTCPYCRQENNNSGLIPIHFAPEVKQLLSIYGNKIGSAPKCPKHNKSITYMCKNCNENLCSDCLFEQLTGGGQHQNHHIIKIEEILKEVKIQIQKELKRINSMMNTVSSYSSNLLEQIEEINRQKEDNLAEMYSIFNNIQMRTIDKLNKQIEEYAQQAQTESKALKTAYNKFQKSGGYTKYDLENMSQEKVLKLLSDIQAIKDIATNLTPTHCFNDFPENEMIPSFTNFDVTIPDFNSMRQFYAEKPENEDHFFYSQNVKLCGSEWRAKIYPNGNGNAIGTHLSIFIEMLDGLPGVSVYTYRVEIVGKNQNYARQYTSEFTINDSWGWNKAIDFDTINTGEFLESDSLTLHLGIKPDTYYLVDKGIRRDISKLKEKIKVLKEKNNTKLENKENTQIET